MSYQKREERTMAGNSVYTALGELIVKYRGTMTQTTVAQLLSDYLGRSIKQTSVSAHENGQRWGDNPDLIGAYAAVLNIPIEVMQRTIGLPAVDDQAEAPTFATIVSSDPTLSVAAKEHLISQYGLLQSASAHERATKKKAAPAQEPPSPEEGVTAG